MWKKLFKRYFLDALGAMALGVFCSLIIGLIISQIAKIPGLSFLNVLSEVLSAQSPVVGSAIGVAIAVGTHCPALIIFSSAATGAIGYQFGGPVGAYIAALAGAEIGRLVSKKTPIDIIVTPFVTIVVGALVAGWAGEGINRFMLYLGEIINRATEMNPFWRGIIVSVTVGIALTLPISSAALCIMLNLSGLAAGAATAGCCAQMIGFALISYRDNGLSGLLSQGLGTSMLQIPNIIRHPRIWIAPILTSAIMGPLATLLFGMTNTAIGAGMGTSGLVGQITTFITMSLEESAGIVLLKIAMLHFLLPGGVALGIDYVMRKSGWIHPGDMTLPTGEGEPAKASVEAEVQK